MSDHPTPAAISAGQIITDETRKIAALTADPRNARRHSQAQIAQIVHSIEEFGFVNRVVIRPTGQIIAGHATTEALRRLSRDDVEVRVVGGLTEAQYQKLALALNRLPENSSWDDDMLAEIMGELRTAGEDIGDIGFSPGEIDKLLKPDDPLAVREIETGPVDDEFWISVRGPLKDQAAALKALELAMKPHADVTVELGTINLG
jgi:ParB-like chromosome segregation protein Spo0J